MPVMMTSEDQALDAETTVTAFPSIDQTKVSRPPRRRSRFVAAALAAAGVLLLAIGFPKAFQGDEPVARDSNPHVFIPAIPKDR
jgi:hypothetical protein